MLNVCIECVVMSWFSALTSCLWCLQFALEKATVVRSLKRMKDRFGKADLGQMFDTNRASGTCKPLMRADDTTYYDPVYGQQHPTPKTSQ